MSLKNRLKAKLTVWERKKLHKNFGLYRNLAIFAHLKNGKTWYFGRAARQWSATPSTAVRIR